MGIVPAVVLPNLSILMSVRSFGIPQRSPVASIIRLFAWCGIKSFISFPLRPFSFRICSETSAILLTANLNTFFPSCLIKCSLLAIVFSEAGFLLPPASTFRLDAPEPSVFRIELIIPLSSFVGSRITPPAPSPNITQVSLSSKSRIDVIVSTPITITFS